jgi:CysZ protein
MFASLRRAAQLALDPAFMGVVFKAIGLTILLFAVALALSEYGLSLLPILSSPLVNEALRWLAPLLFLFGGIVLGPPVAALFASLFLNEIASRIEARDYPGWHAHPASFARTLRAGLKLAALIVGVDLVLLPIDIGLPAVGEVVSLAANGLLLGREYFELVALRHMDLGQASQLRRSNSSAVWAAGTLIALSSMIPVINLVGPLLGTSVMVHLFHRFAQPAKREIKLEG